MIYTFRVYLKINNSKNCWNMKPLLEISATYISNLKLDDKYTKFILDKIIIFKFFHPNLITLIGLITDFFVLYSIKNKHLVLLAVFLFVRYSADCLDGAVARKYKKVSNLGGFLDTLSDNTLIFIVTYGLCFLLGSNNLITPSIVVCFNLLYLFKHKAILHHSNIKKKIKGDFFHNTYVYFVNNNVLLYILIFLVFWALLSN
jgi:phosphatidylglycerophosphate synthase